MAGVKLQMKEGREGEPEQKKPKGKGGKKRGEERKLGGSMEGEMLQMN